MQDESSGGKLKAIELYRLLDYLRDYMNSPSAVIKSKLDSPDSCGNIVHLNGPAFLTGFREYLKERFLEADELVQALVYVMEISAYVRNGGIKAIIYRLETGRCNIVRDYFDSIAQELAYEINGEEFIPLSRKTNSNFLLRLKSFDPEDEMRVSAAISEIDQLLLELGKRLEQVSLQGISDPDIKLQEPGA